MLGIVLVNYKTNSRLVQYLNSELVKVKNPHKIVIVNNSCTDESNQELIEGCGAEFVTDRDSVNKNTKIFLLGEQENHGYARGNNIGAQFFNDHFPEVNYLCFSNCDLFFKDADVVETLIHKLATNRDVGIIGPRIFSIDSKQDQSPRKMGSIWISGIFCSFFLPLLPPKIRRRITITEFNAQSGDCDCLAGPFFVANKEAFCAAGMFDPYTFLYSEEPILASRIRGAGFRVCYCAEVTILHDHPATSRSVPFKQIRARRWQGYRSTRYYYKRYYRANLFEMLMYDLAFYFKCYVWGSLFAFRKFIKK